MYINVHRLRFVSYGYLIDVDYLIVQSNRYDIILRLKKKR